MHRFTASRVSEHPVTRQEMVPDINEAEVYFLILHFLAKGPCQRAFKELCDESLQHNLLSQRHHSWYSRQGFHTLSSGNDDAKDDGKSLPVSYRDMIGRDLGISNSLLMDLLRQLTENSNKSAIINSLVHESTIVDTSTLLGSLLDSERNKGQIAISGWTRPMRWPHWHAKLSHGLMLREIGGGFARHHRPPAVTTTSYAIGKPSVVYNRFQMKKILLEDENAVDCVTYDETLQHIITSSDHDHLVKIWSRETGRCLCSCPGHEDKVTDLTVSTNNSLVASASKDRSIRVWSLPDGSPVSLLLGHSDIVSTVLFSPGRGCEHHLLSCSVDGQCRIWDARDSSVTSQIYNPEIASESALTPTPDYKILSCAFNTDGSMFVTGSKDKLARVWNVTMWNNATSENHEVDILRGHEKGVDYVSFSTCATPMKTPLAELTHEEKLRSRSRHTCSIYAHAYNIVTRSTDWSAIIWTPQPRGYNGEGIQWEKAYHLRIPACRTSPQTQTLRRLERTLWLQGMNVGIVVYSLDNKFVIGELMDHKVCVWKAVDGSLVHSLAGHDAEIYVLQSHPFDPRMVMSVGFDGRVIIWDIWNGNPVRIFETGSSLVDGDFSSDGLSLMVSDEVGNFFYLTSGGSNSHNKKGSILGRVSD